MVLETRRRRRATAMGIACGIGLLPICAGAQTLAVEPLEAYEDYPRFEGVEEREFGLGTASMYLRYAHAREGKYAGGVSDVWMGGLSARAIYGKRIAYGAGLGFELGASHAAGFGAGVDFYPAGFALAFGPTGYIGTFWGIGINGIASRIPFAFVLPAELRIEFDIANLARFGALMAIAWTPGEAPRKDASALLPFADETLMALTARLGKTFTRYGANMGRGYFLRLERREQMRTVWLGLSFGVEIDYAQ